MIHRQGPVGEVFRSADGQALWNVERPHTWRARIYDFAHLGSDTTDIGLYDGVLVWLALVPRPGESGVRVSLREGTLHVEPASAA